MDIATGRNDMLCNTIGKGGTTLKIDLATIGVDVVAFNYVLLKEKTSLFKYCSKSRVSQKLCKCFN